MAEFIEIKADYQSECHIFVNARYFIFLILFDGFCLIRFNTQHAFTGNCLNSFHVSSINAFTRKFLMTKYRSWNVNYFRKQRIVHIPILIPTPISCSVLFPLSFCFYSFTLCHSNILHTYWMAFVWFRMLWFFNIHNYYHEYCEYIYRQIHE